MSKLSLLTFLCGAGLVAGAGGVVKRQDSLTGDEGCGRYMCVTAVVNSSTVEYTLSSTGSMTPGWMAMGFGAQMTNAPMIIAWANDDNSITLSQREAAQYSMPTVVASPERVATLQDSLSVAAADGMKFVFTVDANSDTSQSIIYAFGITNPGDSDPGATIQRHLEAGVYTLDLTGTLSSTATGGTGTGTTTGTAATSTRTTSGSDSSSSDPTSDIPLQPYQRLIVAHAVFCSLGFLVFLPLGAILARLARTFTTKWYKAHESIQLYLAGITIIIGFALGVQSVSSAKALHLDDAHKKWGVALFVLYIVQCGLGYVIHTFKAPNAAQRPPQNYLHGVLGVSIISLSFYQVHTGYKTEWPNTTGRGDAPASVGNAWIAWVIIIPVAYFGGLAFLPKQYKQEAEARKARVAWSQNPNGESQDQINMSHVGANRYSDA